MQIIVDHLKKLFAGEPPSVEETSTEEHALALGILMVIAAKADGVFDEQEKESLKAVLAEEFNLSEAETDELLQQAIQGERDAIDLFSYARVLTKDRSYTERLTILKLLFRVIGADGEYAFEEEERIHKIAASMGVTAADFGAVRAQAKHK